MRDPHPHDALLRLMADGQFHSGQALAASLAVGRSAVWKQVRRLQELYNLRIDAVRGRGYRLRDPIHLLLPEKIVGGLSPAIRRSIESFDVVLSTPSTNSLIAARPPRASNRAHIVFAEHQSAARGRRGRRWVGGLGDNISCSIAWRFELAMSELSSLSLAVGVAVAEALESAGLSGHQLKWPNDVIHDGKKLAGILVEVSGEATGPATAIIGVGINVRVPTHVGTDIDQPWIDVSTMTGGEAVSRDDLAVALVEALVAACTEFASSGLASFAPRWQRYDALKGRTISVHTSTRSVEGTYVGISANGALLMENESGRSEHLAGEVSVRRVTQQ